MPSNRPVIPNPIPPRSVVTSEGETLTLGSCAKCEKKFYASEDAKESLDFSALTNNIKLQASFSVCLPAPARDYRLRMLTC
jgi:hypothetical protein